MKCTERGGGGGEVGDGGGGKGRGGAKVRSDCGLPSTHLL